MKKSIMLLVIVILLTACQKTTPLEYYNQCISVGNISLTICDRIELRVTRLSKGWNDKSNLFKEFEMSLPVNEKQLEKLKALKGNSESDKMVQASINFLQFAMDCSKDKKMKELFTMIYESKSAKEAFTNLGAYKPYIDSIYAKEKQLYKVYDAEVGAYANAKNIAYKKV